MTEEKKMRTEAEIKAEYSHHATQLGEKTHFVERFSLEVAHHRKRLLELYAEHQSLPVKPAVVTESA